MILSFSFSDKMTDKKHLVLFLTTTAAITILPPNGEIKGPYYMTNDKKYTVTMEKRNFLLQLDLQKLTEILKTPEETDITISTVKHYNDESREFNIQREGFPTIPNATNSKERMLLYSELTAQKAAMKCQNAGGNIFNIEDDYAFNLANQLIEETNKESKKASGNTVTVSQLWQSIKLQPEGIPTFEHTNNPIPRSISNTEVTKSLNDLQQGAKCAFFTMDTKTFYTATCNDEVAKKFSICKLSTTSDDIFSLKYPIINYQEKLKELKTTLELLNIETTKLPILQEEWKNQEKIPIKILTTDQTKVIKNIKTTPHTTITSKGLTVFAAYIGKAITRAQGLLNSLKSRNFMFLLPYIQLITTQPGENPEPPNIKSENVVKTDFATEDNHLIIQLTTGETLQHTTAKILNPLIINDKEPIFKGRVFLTESNCYHNPCTSNPCHIKHFITIPCCEKYILNKDVPCQNSSPSITTLANINDNKFVISTQETTISSKDCPDLHKKIKGTVLLNISPSLENCDILIDNTKLPVTGTAKAKQLLPQNEQITLDLVQGVIDKVKQKIQTVTSTQVFNQYILPAMMVLGTIAALLSTSISAYLFFKNKLNPAHPTINQEQIQEAEQIPLKPILKEFRLRSSTMQPLQTDTSDEDSSD